MHIDVSKRPLAFVVKFAIACGKEDRQKSSQRVLPTLPLKEANTGAKLDLKKGNESKRQPSCVLL